MISISLCGRERVERERERESLGVSLCVKLNETSWRNDIYFHSFSSGHTGKIRNGRTYILDVQECVCLSLPCARECRGRLWFAWMDSRPCLCRLSRCCCCSCWTWRSCCWNANCCVETYRERESASEKGQWDNRLQIILTHTRQVHAFLS